MGCCANLIKLILFLLNFLCFFGFCCLVGGFLYVFIVDRIATSDSNFPFLIVSLVVSSVLAVFTFLGCCGSAIKSLHMMRSFTLILVLLFLGVVGALIYLHFKHGDGKSALRSTLRYDLDWSIRPFQESEILMRLTWDWLQPALKCCGMKGSTDWPKSSVPQSCFKSQNNTFTDGCADKILRPPYLTYVLAVFYGVPSLMLLSLIFAIVVAASLSSDQRHLQAIKRDKEEEKKPVCQDSGETEEEDSTLLISPTDSAPPPPSCHLPLLAQAPPCYN